MSEMIPFQFESHAITVIRDDDGKPWFLAKQVCEVLGIRNVGDALARLDDDERRDIGIADVTGRIQQMATINEPGLYSTMFRSRRPEAKKFKRWVTHDVLPMIMRTGAYVAPGANPSSVDAAAIAAATAQAMAPMFAQMASAIGSAVSSAMAPAMDKIENLAAKKTVRHNGNTQLVLDMLDGGMKPSDIAKALGISKQAVFNMENSARNPEFREKHNDEQRKRSLRQRQSVNSQPGARLPEPELRTMGYSPTMVEKLRIAFARVVSLIPGWPVEFTRGFLSGHVPELSHNEVMSLTGWLCTKGYIRRRLEGGRETWEVLRRDAA